MRSTVSLAVFGLLCVSCLASLTGCAGGGTLAAAPSLQGLPSLPQDGPAPARLRHSSGTEDIVIPGNLPFANDPSATIVPSGLRLTGSGASIGWAIYQVGGLDAERYVTSIDLTESNASSDYWIALGDYSLGFWTVVKSSSQLNESFPVSNPANYTSPGGNLYFALIVSDALLVHNQATIHITNNAPPELDIPANLSATPGDTKVSLGWDAYMDLDASGINIYQSTASDMSGASLAGSVPTASSAFDVTGLTNGQLYYFALKATDGSNESDYSNIASATPDVQVELPLALGGIWGRLGKDSAGTGRSNVVAPTGFGSFASKNLTSNRFAGACRTSPVLDSQGNVYALSRDGVFSSWTGDLANSRFSTDLASRGGRGAQLIPPQPPCVDADDNIYFASVDSDTGGLVFWGFDHDGGPLFDKDYPSSFSKDSDNDRPFPSLNIAGGFLVSSCNDYQDPLALNKDGSEAWRISDYRGQMEFSAEPVYQESTDSFEWPISFTGIAIDPRRHWLSLHSADGSLNQENKALGSFSNYFGGIALASAQHYYPEPTHLRLLNSADGTQQSQIDLALNIAVGPAALDASGDYIYQPIYQNEGIVVLGKFECYKINNSIDPPSLDFTFSQVCGSLPLTGKPAVDAGNNAFFADEGGNVYRLSFNPALPVDQNNPTLVKTQLDAADTYKYSSFALANGAAYICTEQNKLYLIGNPFLD